MLRNYSKLHQAQVRDRSELQHPPYGRTSTRQICEIHFITTSRLELTEQSSLPRGIATRLAGDFVGNLRTCLAGGFIYRYRFEIQRELLETVVANKAVDWSNALFLSARFRAWRDGDFNENVYNFFKSLSSERMGRTEVEAFRRVTESQEIQRDEVQVGDYVVERFCPHRQADLGTFGVIEGDELVCTLHGWRFDLASGACRSSVGKSVKIRKR